MSETKTLKPAPGIKLYNPATKRFVAEEGEAVVMDKYWRGRIADGDAVIVPAATADATAKPAKTSKAKE